jgi:hypothetical protein
MKKINWEVAKEKAKGSLDGVGNSEVSQKFMAIGQKLVKFMQRKR